jgi:hypothetical protein
MRYILVGLLFLALLIVPLSHASYIVTSINTTVTLNQNTSGQVIEIFKVSVSNASVSQYTADRLALNLTLSQWQSLIGPQLVENIVNPRGSIYDFDFLPGPLAPSQNGKVADLVLSYSVTNVTTVTQTGPRTFLYDFDNSVFNFQNAISGPVLGDNTTLNIIIPQGARIIKISPNPDFPAYGFTQNYRNATYFSWDSDESLGAFTFNYVLEESLEQEVVTFFQGVYNTLGAFAYILIILAVALFIAYTYLKAGK